MSAIDRYYEFKVRFDDWLYGIKWIRAIQHKYWKLIPYEFRPSQVWYKTKCFLWHRYTTVKPRYLGHGWYDRCGLLPHVVFEILSDFIENECSPGHIDWYYKDDDGEFYKTISRGGKKINVRDEMQDLYDWWHKIYIPWNKNTPDLTEWHDHYKKHLIKEWTELEDGNSEYTPKFDSEEAEKEDKRLFDRHTSIEKEMDRQLKRNLHRIVNIMDYMWT